MRNPAISRGDLLRHSLARELRQRIGGGYLHRLVDCGRTDVKRATKQEREAQDIIDLIRKIRPAGGDDCIGPCRAGNRRRYLRVGVGHSENDWLGRHRLYHIGAKCIGRRQAQKHIGTDNCLGQIASLGLGGVGRLPLVHAVGSALVDYSRSVAHNNIVVRHAHRLDEFGTCNRRRASAVADYLDVLECPVGQHTRVDKPGGGDDRGAVLIIMKHRNVHPFAQSLLDDEARRGGDIFEVDAAKSWLEQLDCVDEAINVFGLHFDVDAIDISKAFEQHRLTLHHRLRCQCAQIAHAQNRSTVGDNRDQIALGGVIISGGRIVIDRLHRHRDTGRISEAQVALRRHRFGRDNLDFAGASLRMEIQCFLRGKLDVAIVHFRPLFH